MNRETNAAKVAKTAMPAGVIESTIFVLSAIVVLEITRHLVDGVGFGVLVCLATYAAISFPCDLYFTRKRQSQES